MFLYFCIFRLSFLYNIFMICYETDNGVITDILWHSVFLDNVQNLSETLSKRNDLIIICKWRGVIIIVLGNTIYIHAREKRKKRKKIFPKYIKNISIFRKYRNSDEKMFKFLDCKIFSRHISFFSAKERRGWLGEQIRAKFVGERKRDTN